MKKKILLMFTLIITAVLIFPANVFAEEFDEFKQSIIVKSDTKESKIDILESEVDETITYDKNTSTLTLNNFNGSKINIRNFFGDLKIKLIGNNNINIKTEGTTSYGYDVYSYGLSYSGSDGSLEVVGSGTLNISSNKKITSGIRSLGGNFIINGANINIESVDVGIDASDFQLKSGSVKISNVRKNGISLTLDTIAMDGNANISGGKLEMIGASDSSSGIYSNGGILDVNGGIISISNFSNGIFSENMGESATVNINDGNINIHDANYGIYMGHAGKLNINGGTLKINNSKSMAIIVTYNFEKDNKISINNKKVAIAQGDIFVQSYSTDEPDYKNNVVGKNGINASNVDSMVAKNVIILPLVDKKVIKTENGIKVTPNTEVKFTFDVDMAKFKSLYINGKLLSSENGDYTVKSGSTIITLSKKYTKGLTDGNYKLMAVFEDGIAYNDFSVGEAKTNTNKVVASNVKNPNTSDNIGTYILLFVVSFIGIFKIIVSSMKRKKGLQ